MGEALANGEVDRAAARAAREASLASSKVAEAKKGQDGRVEAAAIDSSQVHSERLQENLKKVSDERRREANRAVRPSLDQLANFRVDAERFGVGVDAHR